MIAYRLFGIPVASSLSFPGDWNDSVCSDDATTVVVDDLPPWSGRATPGWSGINDGERFEVIRSESGQYRFLHGGAPLFALSANFRTLTCAPPGERSVTWWRLLLDSALFTVSLLRGNDALHAGAVSTPGGVLAMVAASGGGKSTLLGTLLAEGAELVTDDVLFLESAEEEILAHPGAPVMTLPDHQARGTVLGRVDDEAWVTLPVAASALPLRRLVLLDRRPGAATDLQHVEYPLAPLMTHFLNFPRTRDREGTRFQLASAISQRAEVWHLVSDVTTAPQELASLALGGLESAMPSH